MNNRQQAIRDALDGGWDTVDYSTAQLSPIEITNERRVQLLAEEPYEYLLQPSFWQAVGRTRGWKDWSKGYCSCCRLSEVKHKAPEWLYNMHRFIDHLADGDSIEEALGKIK